MAVALSILKCTFAHRHYNIAHISWLGASRCDPTISIPLVLYLVTMFGDQVSGIHRLFTAASSQSYNSPHLESVTEEAHTHDLLWPDFDTLQQSQDQVHPLRDGNSSSLASAAASFDDRGGLNIQSPCDIRILVAQDSNAVQQAKILFDSHPPPPLPVVRLGSPTEANEGITGERRPPAALANRTNTSPGPPTRVKHARYFSLSRSTQAPPLEQPSSLGPAPENRGAFGNPGLRRTITRPATSDGETRQNRLAREGKEEIDALLDCIFSSAGSPLVSGTKLHVRPSVNTEVRNTPRSDAYPISPETAPFQPHVRRRTPLTRSTTADNIHQASASASAERAETHFLRPQSASILITRVFTVDSSQPLSPHLSGFQGQRSFQEPEVEYQNVGTARRSSNISDHPGARQYKSPAYALSLVLRLPSASRQGWPSAPRTTSPFSLASQAPSGGSQWQEARLSDGLHYGGDRDIEQIIIHWGLLTKILSSLESFIKMKLARLLAIANLSSPHPNLDPSAMSSNGFMSDQPKLTVGKIKQPSQVQLPANALQECEDVRREASRHSQRVALVLRTRRVVTGQGCWGVWREEARRVGRWAGNREQNFFFYNLLTAFLGFHLDWVESLKGTRALRFLHKSEKRKPASYIRQQQTVIVSSNKMAARRLIFLLAIFLPTVALQVQDAMVASRSSRVGSSLSQSPPSGISTLREQSLRRTINRRHRGNRSSHGSTALHKRSLSFAGEEAAVDRHDEQSCQFYSAQHSRRASTARSIMAPTLPLATSGESTRKSSTTTISTVVPETAVPVAHFSTVSRDPLIGTTPAPRPGSSGSLASLSLQHTLHRSESNEQSNTSSASQSFGRWGSMMSGFWSSRRESSTEGSDSFSPSAEGLGISWVSRMPSQTSSAGTLERMVEEAETVSQFKRKSGILGHNPPNIASPDNVRKASHQGTTPSWGISATEARAIPERPKGEVFPVKLSVDDNDGIIDVGLPAPDSCASSFGSSVGSTGPCHTAPSSFNDRASILTRSPSKERLRNLSQSPTDTAGWLKEYSPDFVLQAVKPYEGLKKDVEEAMQAESNLSTKRANTSDISRGWRDVRSCLVADAMNFSITRFCFQRRSKQQSTALSTSAGAEPGEQSVEERMIEESIMDHDPILIDAIERLLAQSGHSSRAQSRAPSRAPSPSRSAPPLEKTRSKSHHDLHPVSTNKENMQYPALEVPKSECKNLVFGALEEVVRSVLAEVGAGSKGARHLSGEPVRNGAEDFLPDSTLREGVRRRIRDVGLVSLAS